MHFLTKIKQYYSIFLLIFVALVLISFSVYVSLAPIIKVREIEETSRKDKTILARYGETAFQSSDLREPLREESFKEAFIKASENDSIFIFIDLKDSLAGLAVNGVIINRVPIVEYKTDKMFNSLSNLACMNLFASPARHLGDYTSIEREPIVIKEAPADSSAADQNILQPEIPKLKPAFVFFELSNNLQLVLCQDSSSKNKAGRAGLKFILGLALKKAAENISGFISIKKPDYRFKTRVVLPADGIYELYRALPQGGQIIIRLPETNSRLTEKIK